MNYKELVLSVYPRGYCYCIEGIWPERFILFGTDGKFPKWLKTEDEVWENAWMMIQNHMIEILEK